MTVTLTKIHRKSRLLQKMQRSSISKKAKRHGKRPSRFNALLKRKAQLTADIPITQIEFVFEPTPAEVTTVRYYAVAKHPYSVCPTCGYALERDFQQFCEECGQRLAWHRFISGDVIVQRIYGPNLRTEEHFFSKKISIQRKH